MAGSPGQRLKFLTRKQRTAEPLLEISKSNVDIVDKLAKEIEKLIADSKYPEADRLILITKDVLENNKKLQKVVGEVLAEND